MPLQNSIVTEDFVFELCQFKQQNLCTDRQTISTVPSAHAGEGNDTKDKVPRCGMRPSLKDKMAESKE